MTEMRQIPIKHCGKRSNWGCVSTWREVKRCIVMFIFGYIQNDWIYSKWIQNFKSGYKFCAGLGLIIVLNLKPSEVPSKLNCSTIHESYICIKVVVLYLQPFLVGCRTSKGCVRNYPAKSEFSAQADSSIIRSKSRIYYKLTFKKESNYS